MFDYFENYSINAHHVCCEDRPTKGLYDHCQYDELGLHSRSQVRPKLDYLLLDLQYFGHYLSYCTQTWHDGRLIDAIYAHDRFDYLDARSQWVGKGKESALHALGN